MQNESAIYRILLNIQHGFKVIDIAVWPQNEKNNYLLETYGNKILPFFNSDNHSCILKANSKEAAIKSTELIYLWTNKSNIKVD